MTFTILLIVFTSLITLLSFQNSHIFQKLGFNPFLIVQQNEWYRFLSHGFIHADWEHLIFNMFTLYFFGTNVELVFGNNLYYLIFYLSAIIFASSATYFKHNKHPYYNAVGASGAVSAVVFASILFTPKASIMIFPLPIPIPGYIYGILFLIYSSNKGRRNNDNINHDAHILGAVFGFIIPLIFNHSFFTQFLQQF